MILSQVVLLPRNKNDGNAENHSKLLHAIKGKGGADGQPIMGTFLRETFDGWVRENWPGNFFKPRI